METKEKNYRYIVRRESDFKTIGGLARQAFWLGFIPFVSIEFLCGVWGHSQYSNDPRHAVNIGFSIVYLMAKLGTLNCIIALIATWVQANKVRRAWHACLWGAMFGLSIPCAIIVMSLSFAAIELCSPTINKRFFLFCVTVVPIAGGIATSLVWHASRAWSYCVSGIRIVIQDNLSCPKCSYSLIGNTTMRCPECGYDYKFEELGTTAEELHRLHRGE